MVELYYYEIGSNPEREQEFENFLQDQQKKNLFSQEDLKHLNKIKEIIYKREVETYEQRIQSKQKELEQLHGDALGQINSLETQAK